jgi:hypothetical protein
VRFVGGLLLLAGLGTIIGFVIPTQQDGLESQPDEKDRPFAQAASDDHRSPVWSLAFSPDASHSPCVTP